MRIPTERSGAQPHFAGAAARPPRGEPAGSAQRGAGSQQLAQERPRISATFSRKAVLAARTAALRSLASGATALM